MENRARILDAAARVYAEYGFRGATTRRIASAAGVNEVTLFRTFGSKERLIDEAVRCCVAASALVPHTLPLVPADPERELTAWASAQLTQLRESRSFIRKAMSEVEERSEAATCAAAPTIQAAHELRAYMLRMAEAGFFDRSRLGGSAPTSRSARRNEHAYAAGTMLMSAVFSDAMGREMMPDMYPQPPERAPALYVRMFLRAIGVPIAEPSGPARRRRRAPSTSPTQPIP
jgi:AcrR family transcriptional regulator